MVERDKVLAKVLINEALVERYNYYADGLAYERMKPGGKQGRNLERASERKPKLRFRKRSSANR